MPPAKKPEVKLDLSKLQKMQPPLAIRVIRRKGHTPEPVNIPAKDSSGPPGTGFEIDDVMQLENYILNSEGGGFYEGAVTDANGHSLSWLFGWDPRLYPEKRGGVPVQPQQPQQQQPQQPMPAPAQGPWGRGQPWADAQLAGMFPQVPQPIPTASPFAQPPQPFVGGYPSQYPGQQYFGGIPFGAPLAPWQQGASTPLGGGKDDERLRRLEESLKEAQMANVKKDYDAQLERTRAESEKRLQVLQDEMRRLAESTKSTESDTARQLREQNEQLRREQERKDAEVRHREELAVIKASTEKQLEALTRMVEESKNKGPSEEFRRLEMQLAEQKAANERALADQRHREEMQTIRAEINARPDPMIEYMKETSRSQAEVSKEIARYQRESTERITNAMINPAQMIDMLQRQSGGMDNVLKSIIGSFGGAFETYRAMMESLIQASGGGQSAGQELLRDGLGQISGMAQSYIAYQRDKAIAEARAQEAMGQAQRASAEALRQARARQPQQGEGLGGAEEGAEAAEPSNGSAAEVIDINERRRGAPSEEDMFGPAVEHVHRLRQGVAEGKLNPEQAAAAILQGVAMCIQNQIEVRAFELLNEGRYADLMDVLLPRASQEYRDAVMQALIQQAAALSQGQGYVSQYEDDDQPEA